MRPFIISIILLSFFSCAQNSSKKILQIPDEYKNTVFEPIAKKLETKDSLFSTDINPLAENPEFRQDLFYLLTHYHREDLFPQKYYSFESAAESNMVNWLQHPNELDTIPSEIALAGKE